jgi:uncharacterized protein with ParB-like and HNH nuclease domain
MGYIDITIKQAIDKIDQNKFLIPSFQREFVWSKTQIEDLFDSLMREYPINSMLFWEVTGNNRRAYEFYQFLQSYVQYWHCHNEPKAGCDSMDSFMAILDGQQRLTAIFLGLKGTVAYHLKYHSWEIGDHNFPPMKLYLNLSRINKDSAPGQDNDESPDSGSNEGMKMFNFKFRTKVDGGFNDLIKDAEGNWLRCGAILSMNVWQFAKENCLNLEEGEVLMRFHNAIHNTASIHYFVENGVSSDKAVDIFVRINSGGRVLSLSDISLSLVIAGWKGLNARKEIQELTKMVSNLGFNINHDYVIKAFLYLLNKPVKTKISTFNTAFLEQTQQEWPQIKLAIIELFRMLKTLGFDSGRLTSLNATLPILFYIYHKRISSTIATSVSMSGQRQIMKKWLLKTLLLKSFGASSDNTLKLARDAMSLSGDYPSDAISKSIRQPESISQATIDELMLTQKDNAYAFSMLALFYPNIDLSNKFNLDHMHPLALIDDYYKVSTEDKKTAYKKYNSIVNLQMLGENQNKSKNDMSLKEWVVSTGKSRKDLLEETYLPERINLDTSNFDEFYSKRKDLLSKALCKQLGVTLGGEVLIGNPESALADEVDSEMELDSIDEQGN